MNPNNSNELILKNISSTELNNSKSQQELGIENQPKTPRDTKKLRIKIKNMNISRVQDMSLDLSSKESFSIPIENNYSSISTPKELNSKQMYVLETKKTNEVPEILLNTIQITNKISEVDENINKDSDNHKNSPQSKKNNPMFWSTIRGMDTKIDLSVNETPLHNLEDKDKELRKEEMKKEIAKLLFQKDIKIDLGKVEQIHKMKTEGPPRNRKDNPLFYSTMPAANKIEVIPRNDSIFEEFLLPRAVTKIIDDENENIKIIESHINQQKQKVSIDIDQIMNDIGQVLHEQRLLIEARLDDYFENYKKNYVVLKEKVIKFKEKAKSVYNIENDLMASTSSRDGIQQTFNPLLQGINFYKITKEADTLVTGVNTMNKVKEEICSLQANVNTINREIEKRLLLYLSDEVSKQTEHKPLYNNGETLQLSFTETKNNIMSIVQEQLKDFSKYMLYIVQPEDLSSIFAFPKIEAAISDDHLSVISDSDQSINLNLFAEKIVHLNNGQEERYTCVHSLHSEVAAVGTEQGFVKFYNYFNDTNIACFQAQGGPVTAITSMKVQLPDISKNYF